jgi:hypothetical protein
MGTRARIDVSWRGPDYLAVGLQARPEVRARFPSLQVNEVVERLTRIEDAMAGASPAASEPTALVPDLTRAPRTAEEESALLDLKPPAWEYLLFAAVLLRERQALESKWHDHELKIGRSPIRGLDAEEARGVLERFFGPVGSAVDRLARVLDAEARIEHLASRLIGGYEELLDLQAKLRGCSPPEEWQEIFELAAKFPDQPLDQIRAFVDECVEHADQIPAFFARPEEDQEPVVVHLTLEVSLGDGLEERFSRALKKLERRMSIENRETY